MPSKKRQYTEEQKQAMRERLVKARAARGKNTANKVQTDVEGVGHKPAEEVKAPEAPVTSPENDTRVILARALEAIESLAKLQASQSTAGQSASGLALTNDGIVGTIVKYSLDPSDYPDPTERLKQEPRLAQFAFPVNYELKYSFATIPYQTKDGRNFVEPQFNLELTRIVRDPSTGEDTGKRYIIGRMTMFEDPQTALIVARQNDLAVDDYSEKAFLDEMRYLQMRDWVFESFFTPLSTTHSGLREEVVDGKLLQIYEVNDYKSTKIDFDKVNRF